MLTPAQTELITAAVDGELSAPEGRAFQRLLETSAEARALHAKLEADSTRVRALPRATPPADLRTKILARIASTTPSPSRRPVRVPAAAPVVTRLAEPAKPAQPREPRTPAWVPVAVAAGLLLCITAGSFAFFNGGSKGALAKNPWSSILPAPHESPTAAPTNPATPAARPDPDAVARSGVSPVPPVPMPKEVLPQAVAVAPPPRSTPHDLIGSPILPKLPPFELVQVRLPFLRTVAELARDDTRQELIEELARERDPVPYRFDLFVRNTARGVEVFQSAAKADGLTVFADAATLEKLKNKQIVSVVIYTEALTSAELAELFAKVSAEDAKFSPRVCDSVHAVPVVRHDELELKAILGLDAGLFKRPTGSGGTGQGAKPSDKPVSAGTIDSVAKTLTNPAKPGDRPAVLMTWPAPAGASRPVPSAELKQFVAKRGDRKPNAIPAIIVIRPAG